MNSALRFTMLFLSITLFIYFFYQWYLLPDGRMDNFLNRVLSVASLESLQLFGIESSLKVVPEKPTDNHYLYLGNRAMVFIGSACNGFLLYVFFGCFILLHAGVWWQKLLFVSAGIVSIFMLNVLRIIALLYTLVIDPNLFEINHHYVFSFIVYGFIFILWRFWLKKHTFGKA